jgi:hypothetical protein
MPQLAPTAPSDPVDTPPGGWLGQIFNGFLIAFTAEGFLALLHRFAGTGLAGKLLGTVFSLVGFISLLLAVCVSLIACSYRHTRWLTLLPALLLTFWKAFCFLPLPAYFSWHNVELWGALSQSLGGASTIIALRRRTGGAAFLFPREATCFADFSWARTSLTLAVKFFIGVPALCAYLLVSAQILVREYSSGFLEITPSGIFTEARIYELNGRKIYLLPTIHIASPAFYETLMDGLPEKSSVILPEGVTDQKGLLVAGMDYSGAADSVGLTAQPDLTVQPKSHAVLRCDADVSNFSPVTIGVLNRLGRVLKNFQSGETEEMLAALEALDIGDPASLWKDILETRNNKVLEGLKQVLPLYEHVAVPWGAAHMPGIERGLLALQARRTETRRVEVFKWKELKLLPQL